MLDRNEDMRTTGTRHPCLGRYKVASQQTNFYFALFYVKVGFAKDGKLLALDMKLYYNAGNSSDLSPSVGYSFSNLT